jgi:UDP-galactopyranose mutase
LADKAAMTIYTGTIDQYFDYCYGRLEYRSLRFETEVLATDNFQGNAVVNYTDRDTPYIRSIEYKHFEFGNQPDTVITREYPVAWENDYEPFYPVNTEENNERHKQYAQKAAQSKNLWFAGRLGAYKYYNMDEIVREAIKLYHHVKHLN